MELYRWIDWNVGKVEMHGLTTDQAEFVVDRAANPFPMAMPHDKFLVAGPTAAGKWIQVIFLLDDDGTAFVIHARPLTYHERLRYRRMMR